MTRTGLVSSGIYLLHLIQYNIVSANINTILPERDFEDERANFIVSTLLVFLVSLVFFNASIFPSFNCYFLKLKVFFGTNYLKVLFCHFRKTLLLPFLTERDGYIFWPWATGRTYFLRKCKDYTELFLSQAMNMRATRSKNIYSIVSAR